MSALEWVMIAICWLVASGICLFLSEPEDGDLGWFAVWSLLLWPMVLGIIVGRALKAMLLGRKR